MLSSAILLSGLLALRPLLAPEVAKAQTQTASPQLYIEPGVQVINAPDNSIRALGKVAIDLNTGNVWGFPTYADSVYPVTVHPGNKTPPTSTPVFLGKFDISVIAGGH
jgi:hypothetical protein